MMKLTALKIDPEFQGKIPPLTFEELEQLEKNIVNDGKVINPIIIWKGLVVDGHNRYAILQKHPDIPYTVHEKDLQIGLKLSSGFAKISWGGVTFRQNKKGISLGNGTMRRSCHMEESVETNIQIWQLTTVVSCQMLTVRFTPERC